MKIESILKTKDKAVYCIPPDTSIFTCIRILNSKRIGAVVVLSPEEEILGIITERDILRLTYESRGNIPTITASAIMTPRDEVTVASPHDDISVAMEIMTNKRVRHLPIVDNGVIQGMITIVEIVESLLGQALNELDQLKS